ncbi:HTH-type transcriptional regulator RutR [Marinibactrum halimedae]|uniref:Pyrimidine utilization regulatory protein R n=1 Tax=Marinibactrum halimedae TaxID=1444977 RepID=A0AA37T8Q3_9GAMM|nr:HTH-type transcriptional regulator RutR [Marinibactrum halimedae]MCD9457975.1 HTH-type transcriptional regulator RutR [Marinibactrum halimedae]GLS27601.1 pyrimidine utilization regulatory protein R [Marinibactrum halimedae]
MKNKKISSSEKSAKRVLSPSSQKRREKAQENKKAAIMKAALDLFSRNGVNGTSIEQIAEKADVSKSNVLYYFKNKEQLYIEVITRLLEIWLKPLQSFSIEQDPIEALAHYIKVKLELSRDYPAESKLFCMEVVQGAPLLIQELESPLTTLIENKVAVIKEWVEQGKLAEVDPYHLIFSIWAITQHYADFNVQIQAVTGKNLNNRAFFNSTLINIQNIILEGVRPRV